jgi:TetR/AcrR family transcriptional repressor of mexJK operon
LLDIVGARFDTRTYRNVQSRLRHGPDVSQTTMPRILTIAGETPASERGREREAAILEAAEQEFLEHGYGATTIDAIAKRAGGSKSTLYRFFPNKAALFHAVVASVVADRRKVVLDPDADIYDSLYEFCFQRLRVVFRKRHWSMLRLIMAERDRFPAIAQAYYELGPRHGREVLMEYFRTLSERGKLKLTADPEKSARFFIGMLMHDWYITHMVIPGKLPTRDQQMAHADQVVRTFLAATLPADS